MKKEEILKIAKKFHAKAEKLPASRDIFPLLIEQMNKEEMKLVFFTEVKKRIEENAPMKRVISEINKGLKTTRRWREDSKNNGLSCLPPVIMGQLFSAASKDIENAFIALAMKEGIDLREELKKAS